MPRQFLAAILLSLLFLTGCSAERGSQTAQSPVRGGGGRGPVESSGTHEMLGLTIPNGFSINVFASGLQGPRLMALSPDGRVFTTDMDAGEIVILPDVNKDGKADRNIVYLSGLNRPNSLAFHEGYIYVAESNRVRRFRYKSGDNKAPSGQTIIPNLPTSGHFTKTIVIGPDGKLYLAMGSSCNVCIESNPQRAAITRYNSDGTGKQLYATGLRNAVGLAFQPGTGRLFATENGRDMLGDNIPPEEINIIRQGGFYGWPYAYGDKVADPELGSKAPQKVRDTIPPAITIQAHSAPLGMTFYTGSTFPASYRGNIFAALHGSWNRSVPVGYKVIRIPMNGDTPGQQQNFVTGFLKSGNRIGRPVGVLVGSDGELYISDDYKGRIYRISYTKTEQ